MNAPEIITKKQVEKYTELLINNGRGDADKYASGAVSALNLKTPAERGKAWLAFNQVAAEQERLAKKEADKEARKAKREALKGKASIKNVCDSILVKSGVSNFERKFLTDIKTKRKLTEKQESFLRALADKNNVEVVGNIENRVSKNNAQNCEHGDLGSLGYVHGSTVVCPYCGKLAVVW